MDRDSLDNTLDIKLDLYHHVNSEVESVVISIIPFQISNIPDVAVTSPNHLQHIIYNDILPLQDAFHKRLFVNVLKLLRNHMYDSLIFDQQYYLHYAIRYTFPIQIIKLILKIYTNNIRNNININLPAYVPLDLNRLPQSIILLKQWCQRRHKKCLENQSNRVNMTVNSTLNDPKSSPADIATEKLQSYPIRPMGLFEARHSPQNRTTLVRQTPLQLAARFMPQVIPLLIDAKADITFVPQEVIAANNNEIRSIESEDSVTTTTEIPRNNNNNTTLLQLPSIDQHGNTILHILAHYGRYDYIKNLLTRYDNINVNIMNNNGVYPIDIVRISKLSIIRLLLDYNAIYRQYDREYNYLYTFPSMYSQYITYDRQFYSTYNHRILFAMSCRYNSKLFKYILDYDECIRQKRINNSHNSNTCENINNNHALLETNDGENSYIPSYGRNGKGKHPLLLYAIQFNSKSLQILLDYKMFNTRTNAGDNTSSSSSSSSKSLLSIAANYNTNSLYVIISHYIRNIINKAHGNINNRAKNISSTTTATLLSSSSSSSCSLTKTSCSCHFDTYINSPNTRYNLLNYVKPLRFIYNNGTTEQCNHIISVYQYINTPELHRVRDSLFPLSYTIRRSYNGFKLLLYCNANIYYNNYDKSLSSSSPSSSSLSPLDICLLCDYRYSTRFCSRYICGTKHIYINNKYNHKCEQKVLKYISNKDKLHVVYPRHDNEYKQNMLSLRQPYPQYILDWFHMPNCSDRYIVILLQLLYTLPIYTWLPSYEHYIQEYLYIFTEYGLGDVCREYNQKSLVADFLGKMIIHDDKLSNNGDSDGNCYEEEIYEEDEDEYFEDDE